MSGVTNDAAMKNPHIVRSDDNRAGLWLGAIDDVWKLGKARGVGGPWKNSAVKAGMPSDPFLMTGFDRKTLTLAHDARQSVVLRIECDIIGTGLWVPYEEFQVAPAETRNHEFPAAFHAYWLRAVSSTDCRAHVQLRYE